MQVKYLFSHNHLKTMTQHPAACFAFWARKGGSWKDYKKTRGSIGKDKQNSERAEYEKEV